MPDNRAESAEGRLTALEEQRLIKAAQEGCADGARRLVETHQDRLHGFVWRMIRDEHDAEEICQDAFLRAFAALGTFDVKYRFSTWLFTIAYRLCLNVIRRRREYVGDVDFDRFSGRSESSDVADAVANTEAAKLLRNSIWEAADRLSPPQRATVLLCYRETLKCQDIGTVVEMPAPTVTRQLH
ncbi:MAG: sigma-70 family RNA polymerase sigma factor, partial [Phycisphaerae bacterium]